MKKIVLILLISTIQIKTSFAQPNKIYQPDWTDLKDHKSPQWFNDAKFGIFIHWGLYSVPAWATPIGKPGDFPWPYFYKNMPYAEWYLNTLKIPGSPTQEYHNKTFGKNFDYYDFIKSFNEQIKLWDPQLMAEQIKSFGAKYVVLTSKHHDGFTLWPSSIHNYNFPTNQPQVSRDIVGELTRAIKGLGLKMGIYYSGGLDWSFNKAPIMDLKDLWTATPEGADYSYYADSHIKELINNYLPDIIWNDVGYPLGGNLEVLLANYFSQVPEGTVNDRWKRWDKYNGDFKTPEYSVIDSITPFKWETCRGIGFSFGYNQLEDTNQYLKSSEIINLLIDVVSKNGNLLLNIGPKADGSIPSIQMKILTEVGNWLRKNGEGIYGSKPWKEFGSVGKNGEEIRYTCKNNDIYVFVLREVKKNEITISSKYFPKVSTIRLLADNQKIDFEQNGQEIKIYSEKITENSCLKLETEK